MVCLPFLRIMGSYVGYKEDQDVQLTPGDHAVAGAVSGMVTRALIQPLDVLKIRFQVNINTGLLLDAVAKMIRVLSEEYRYKDYFQIFK